MIILICGSNTLICDLQTQFVVSNELFKFFRFRHYKKPHLEMMKASFVISLFALIGLSAAQGLPICAHECVNGAIKSTGCKGVDVRNII